MDLPLLYAAINFALFVGLLGFLLRKPMREFWGNRSEELRTRIAQAQERRAKAEREHTELSTRVDQLEQEMEAVKAQMKADGELEKQKIIEESQDYAKRLAESTQRVAEQELSKTRYRLRQSVGAQTVAIASKIIRQDIKSSDQDRLVKEYLDSVAAEGLQVVTGGRV